MEFLTNKDILFPLDWLCLATMSYSFLTTEKADYNSREVKPIRNKKCLPWPWGIRPKADSVYYLRKRQEKRSRESRLLFPMPLMEVSSPKAHSKEPEERMPYKR